MPSEVTDVRMKGFARRASVDEAVDLIRQRVVSLPAERCSWSSLADRVLAESLSSPVDLPAFPRSAMDGYAVRSPAQPGQDYTIIGEAFPGRPFAGEVSPGQAVRIMTGAPIPTGADCVVPVEQTECSPTTVRLKETFPSGKNCIRVGEDVSAGQQLLPAGRRLRPQDLGLLAAVGLADVAVVRRPRVALYITGEELLPPGSIPSGYSIVDCNSPMLMALIARDGGDVRDLRRVPDQPDELRRAIRESDADLVLITGGTSVGSQDYAPMIIAELGELPIHGIALRPAAPTGIGFLPENRPVFLLPGNPVSCLCAYDLFAARAIRQLGGRDPDWPYPRHTGILAEDILSASGRVDYIRVIETAGKLYPIRAGASNLSSTVLATGFLLVPAERDRLLKDESLTWFAYDLHAFQGKD